MAEFYMNEYVPESSRYAYSFDQRNLEFPFPDKWYPNKGLYYYWFFERFQRCAS